MHEPPRKLVGQRVFKRADLTRQHQEGDATLEIRFDPKRAAIVHDIELQMDLLTDLLKSKSAPPEDINHAIGAVRNYVQFATGTLYMSEPQQAVIREILKALDEKDSSRLRDILNQRTCLLKSSYKKP